MNTQIRKYKNSDKKALVKCLEDLVDYIIPLDPLKRCRRLPEFGKQYTDALLKKIEKQNGVIYIAEVNNKIVGCIVGIVQKQTEEELLECIPTRRGRILDLFVDQRLRKKRIGSMLMKKIEDYFGKKGCDIARVEAFLPNKAAHQFYKKLGFHDRDIDMMKEL